MLLAENSVILQQYSDAKDEMHDFLLSIRATKNDRFDFTRSLKQIYCFSPESPVPSLQRVYEQKDIEKTFKKIDKLKIDEKCNYYIVKNSFKSVYRRKEELFSLDNIVFDIDNHTESDFKRLDANIDRLISLLDTDYKDKFPEFNVVYTGRGVQVWVGLISFRAFPSIVEKYERICEHFCEFLDKIIKENEIDLEIDAGPSKDATRMLRLPCSYNTKRPDFKVAWKHRTDKKYALYDFFDEFSIEQPVLFDFSAMPKVTETKKEKSADKPQNSPSNKEEKVSEGVGKGSRYKGDTPDKANFTNLGYKRMSFIEKLVSDANGDCEGRRNNLLMLYYSSALIVADRESAVNKTLYLNSRFTKPMPKPDVDKIFKYADKHGRMHFTNKTFFELCGATNFQKLGYISQTSKEYERENARQKKKERNIRIHTLSAEGMSLRQIAKEVGCAVNTVRSVLAEPMPEQTLPASEQHTEETVTIITPPAFINNTLTEDTAGAYADNSALSVNVSIDDS